MSEQAKLTIFPAVESSGRYDFASGGGRVIGEGCHFIDLVSYLAGHPVSSMQMASMSNPLAQGNPPDTVTITLTCKDGSLGTIHYFANGSKDFAKEHFRTIRQKIFIYEYY